MSERCGWRRVRLESVADWLAASDPGPQLTSSDYPGPALTSEVFFLKFFFISVPVLVPVRASVVHSAG